MKFNYNDPYEVSQMEAHINYLEGEVETLNEALIKANETIRQLKNENSYLKSGRKQFERESREQIRQEVCDHVWGEENWHDPCFCTRKCIKCGKVETFYERD
jgi:TolA-binding protein